MATQKEIDQAIEGATATMKELGYEVRGLPRHDERGIAVLLASKGKEQRIVCAVNKNNHPNDQLIPKEFDWFVRMIRENSGLVPNLGKFDVHYDIVITWHIDCEEPALVSMRISDIYGKE